MLKPRTRAKTHIMKQAKVTDKHVRARRADNRDAEVGRRVRSRRLECRLSQTELAERAGISRVYVSELERDRKSPTVAVLIRIGEVLGVRASTLLMRTEDKLK